MCKWIDDQVAKIMPYWDLPLRLVLGVVFIAHGAQKLFGWFGGPGFQGWTEAIAGMGMNPPWLFAALGGGGEFFGGIFLLLGLFTRFGALLIAGTMFVAVFMVHLKYGLFAKDNGFEYPLTLLAAAVTFMITGAQAISLDAIICKKKSAE